MIPVPSTFTEHDRKRAVEAKRAKALAGQRYKRDWLDSPLWEELARKRAIRLPQWTKAPTPNALKKWLRILDGSRFEDVYGCSPTRLIALNPHTPLRAFIGQMLELAGESRGSA